MRHRSDSLLAIMRDLTVASFAGPGFLLLVFIFLGVNASPVWAHAGDAHKLEQLNRTIASSRADQKTYISRAALYTRAKQYKLALTDFKIAQTLGEPILVSYELARFHFQNKHFELAAQLIEEYLQAFPHYLPALELRAKSAREQGNHSLALDYFKDFLNRSPYANPGQYIAAAKTALGTAGMSNINNALAVIDSGIKRFGLNPQLQKFAIELALQQSDFDSALSRHQSLEQITSASPQWHFRYAQLLIAAQRKPQAIVQLQLAQQKNLQYRRTTAVEKLAEQTSQLLLSLENSD